MSEATKLVPCPFCGGDPAVGCNVPGVACWSVACIGCDYEIGSEDTKEEAIEWWNRRTHGPATTSALSELVELLTNPAHGTLNPGEHYCLVTIPDRDAFLREQGAK